MPSSDCCGAAAIAVNGCAFSTVTGRIAKPSTGTNSIPEPDDDSVSTASPSPDAQAAARAPVTPRLRNPSTSHRPSVTRSHPTYRAVSKPRPATTTTRVPSLERTQDLGYAGSPTEATTAAWFGAEA